MVLSAQNLPLQIPGQSTVVYGNIDDIFVKIDLLPNAANDPLKYRAKKLHNDLHGLVRLALQSVVPDLHLIEGRCASPADLSRELVDAVEKQFALRSDVEKNKIGDFLALPRWRFATESDFNHAVATKVIDLLHHRSDLALALDLIASAEFAPMYLGGSHGAFTHAYFKAQVDSALLSAVAYSREYEVTLLALRTSSGGGSSYPMPASLLSIGRPVEIDIQFPIIRLSTDDARKQLKSEDPIYKACEEMGHAKQLENNVHKKAVEEEILREAADIKHEEEKIYSMFPELREILKNLLVSSQHVFVDGPLLGFRKLLALSEAKQELERRRH